MSYLKQNLATIFAAMQAAGIKKAEVIYFGQGDSGQNDEIQIDGKDESLYKGSEKISFAEEGSTWAEGSWLKSTKADLLALPEALDRIAYLLQQQDNSGYENNEGGGGTITLIASEKKVVHEHYFNVIIQEISKSEMVLE